MAQSHTNSNPSTRRSLRLIKAERKSASAVTPEFNIDDDDDSQLTARQAKYKAIEAISIGNSKRRSEPDIESNEDQQAKDTEEPSEEQPSNSNYRKRTHSKQVSSSSPQHSIRHVANTVSYRKRNKTSSSRLSTSSTKTLKRQRQSSSEDEGERDERRLSTHSKPKRNSAPIISNRTRSRSSQRKRTESASDLDQASISAETGNLCVRRGQGGRDLTTVASDPSNSQNRRSRNSNHQHRQSSHKRPIDYLTTGQSTSSRSSVPSTNTSGTDGRSCNSNTGLGSSASASAVTHPLQFFNSPAYYQQRGSSPPTSSAQSYSGIVPTGSSYSSGLVASAASASTHRHSKVSIPMSTESDTDPENNLGHMSPTTPRDVLSDPAFARAAAAAAAAAAGSPTGAALFHTLSGRVQHLMNRVSGSSMHAMNGRLQQYMQGIQSPDPDVRLSTLNELCSLLVMSNEETLPGFQFRALYPSLRDCLADTHEAHTEIALTACRALTYLMEALPRSAGQVVEATPIFLSKLRSITSIDIAEQALTALEMISKRHGKQILIADGISACLEYIDFFSITSQNKSLAIVSNCCLHIVTRQEFHYIRPHLENLSNRLRSDEKKTVEHVCQIFSRLVENFHRDASILREIASDSLLKTMQTMLIVQPSLLNSLTFVSIIHMLYRFSAYCPILAVTLLKMNIADTMITLLVGSNESKATLKAIPITYKSATLGSTTVTTNSSSNSSSPIQSVASMTSVELIPRTPQELFEIVSLIGEMMPRLPSDDPLFQVDQLYRRSTYHSRSYETHGGHGHAFWHWQDDQGQLRPYSHQDSRAIEHAWQQHEEEVQLMIGGRSYLIDLQQLQQINEETNHVRFIKRLINPEIPTNEFNDDNLFSSRITTVANNHSHDPRSEMMKEHADLYNNFIQSLFTILYEVYNSSAGPAVKHRCLQALLRMIYYSSSDLLEQILKQQSISSHIASMLASSDYKIIISALQMAEILMKKLPNIFSVYFYREGVVHQIEILIGFGVSSSSNLSMTRTSNSRSQLDLTHSNEDPSTTPEEQPISRAVSRRHQTTADFQTATARIETRSQRARLPNSSRLKAPTRSIFDEMSSKSATALDVNIHRTRSTRESLLFRPNSSMDPNNYYSRPPVYVPSPYAYASSAPAAASFLIPTPASPMILSSQEKTNLREWIKNQAERFRQTYFSKTSSTSNIALQIIHRLGSAVDLLHVAKTHEENAQALREIASIIGKGDVSPFEMVHSGLITKLFQYLTDDLSTSHNRVDRLKQFLEIFLSMPTVSSSSQDLQKEEREEQALKQYIIDLHHSKSVSTRLPTQLFSHLIQKLHGCINHLEQFPIRVNDIAGRPAQSSALRLITTHQLKCNLVRHPQCKTLKQWTSGPVKIDPLALVSAIEKYLLLRGIGITNPEDPTSPTEDDDDDDDEDEDNESEVTNESDNEDVINVLTRASSLRLEFTINDHVIPHHMTIYQAVRLYSNASHPRIPDVESETDNDDSILGSSMLWSRIHTIHYRQATIQPPSNTVVATTMNTAIGGACTTTSSSRLRRSLPASTASTNSRKSSKSSKRQSLTTQIDDLWNHGQLSNRKSLLNCSLNEPISSMLTINDLSLNAIFLLRIFQGLNLYWYDLYVKTNTLINQPNSILTLISRQEFLSSKLTSKVNRQLQDPVVIMMGQIPPWITELARSCLFLFPFETRQMLFYPCAFDRERAMQRLLENSDVFTQQQHPNDQTDRQSIVPRIERKKVQLSRTNILNEMEKILDHWNSKQYLEVQYENEVGFGLGPTLEAYALLSKELQRNGLELWRTDRTFDTTVKDKDAAPHSDYVDNRHGLFPAPLPRNGKASTISKIRQKFKFIGKFMAKALMDSRLIDIPFSLIFYKWLLGQEESFNLEDMIHVDSSLYEQLKRFQNIVHRRDQLREQSQHQSNNIQTKKRLKSKDDLSPCTNQLADASDPSLLLDGCSIDDLSLVFVLPGYPTVELKKGGKDCSVTLENLDQYIDLIVHWTLVEGVRRQFEAVRDGFNSMFSIEHLKYFYADEIQQVFCGHGSTDLWDIKVLVESTRCDHGYNINSRPVKWLFELMSQFNTDEQRAFLQFVTGSPRLPVGGFRMLHPPLTIVRKTAESNNDNTNPDAFLPSVMTCVNYLKLPEYSSKDILKNKLFTAIRDGQYAFLLS